MIIFLSHLLKGKEGYSTLLSLVLEDICDSSKLLNIREHGRD